MGLFSRRCTHDDFSNEVQAHLDLEADKLHVGAAVIDLRFWRTKNGESDYEVLEKRGPLHIVRQPSPWSLTATFGERLHDALSSFLPGK